MAVEIGHTDKIASVLLLGLAAGIFVVTADFPAGPGETGPAFYPRALAVLIALFAVIQLAKSVSLEGVSRHEIELEETVQVLGALVLLVAYVLLIPQLGFALSTVAFLIVSMRYSGVRSYSKMAAISVGLTVVLYYTFAVFLRVPLPTGEVVDVSEWLPDLPLEVLALGVVF